MNVKSDDNDWCPTQAGNFPAYKIEWRPNDKEEWQEIPTETTVDGKGAPYPRWLGGISRTIGLYGYAQAQAIAWLFAAKLEAEGIDIEVRTQTYEVVYDIKARKVGEKEKTNER